MRAVFATRAELDVYEIVERIARDDLVVALRWGQRIADRADLAARMPRSGRMVPEYNRADVREVFVGTYRVIYRVERTMIFVLSVFEGSMRLPWDLDPDEPVP